MGRRPVITTELTKKICHTLSSGHYLATACKLAGVPERTVHDWIRKGEESGARPPYKEFAHAIKKAIAKGEDTALKRIETSAQSSWQAAAWLLERRHPDKWAQRPRKVDSGSPVALPGGITVIFNIPRPDPSKLPAIPPATDAKTSEITQGLGK